MKLQRNQEPLHHNDVWIISKGRHAKFDLGTICRDVKTTFVREYRISDLAKYLLDPNPIEVKKMLIGCEVNYHQTFSDKAREKVRQILPPGLQGLLKDKKIFSEVLIANCEGTTSSLKDSGLKSHVEKICSALRVYNPMLKSLSKLERGEVSNITGICEDIGGNRSLLNLKGDIEEKIGYVSSCIMKDIGVILEKAYVSDGLFEMSGFDFLSYDANNSHRLIKFYADGRPKLCIIGIDGKVEFWVEEARLLNHMHLLEHSIRANFNFRNSLTMCSQGEARPLRLLFKKRLEIDYAKSPLPELYRDIFDTCDIGSKEKDAVMRSLKNSQLGILFNYVPVTNSGGDKLHTNVSVMHDIKALEPIKDQLPELYSRVNKMALKSEAGKYYLLDSIKGYNND
ncbi:MAG: hypothetical protein JRJ15_04230 [Deltaproteobacteria bacterium]|nr:hypothetical protein [Deltaproteobacteria bacterium]